MCVCVCVCVCVHFCYYFRSLPTLTLYPSLPPSSNRTGGRFSSSFPPYHPSPSHTPPHSPLTLNHLQSPLTLPYTYLSHQSALGPMDGHSWTTPKCSQRCGLFEEGQDAPHLERKKGKTLQLVEHEQVKSQLVSCPDPTRDE